MRDTGRIFARLSCLAGNPVHGIVPVARHLHYDAPSQVPWGEKAFSAYLGDDREAWKQYDATELVATAQEKLPILIDQGGADEFLDNQLRPQLLQAACEKAGHPLELRIQPGYDHSYYFISSFIGDHIAHHAKAMR